MTRDLTLEEMIELLRGYEMSPAEKEEQRRCWAHGNVALSNPAVTREVVDAAADELAAERAANDSTR